MEFKFFLVFVILLLAPFTVSAETCLDIDDDFNIIEYECGNRPVLEKQAIKIRPFIKLAGGYNSIVLESWFVDMASLPYLNETAASLYGSAGISIKPNKKKFYDIELAGIYTSNDYIKNNSILMNIYAGYYLLDSFAVYAGLGAGYATSREERPYDTTRYNTISNAYLNLDASGPALHLAAGIQYDIISWLSFFAEYSYTLQRTYVQGKFIAESIYGPISANSMSNDITRSFYHYTLSFGLKAIF